MLDLKVYYDNGAYHGTSRVYYIDANRDRFLVCTPYFKFLWVDTEDCTLETREGEIEND